VSRIWVLVEEHWALYPHTWVRQACAQLLGALFFAWPPVDVTHLALKQDVEKTTENGEGTEKEEEAEMETERPLGNNKKRKSKAAGEEPPKKKAKKSLEYLEKDTHLTLFKLSSLTVRQLEELLENQEPLKENETRNDNMGTQVSTSRIARELNHTR
jgi:hypothetical protein